MRFDGVLQTTKSILFISALDFKQKSIQVLRKTPEAYVKAGWRVHYIVARDTSSGGNYSYEDERDIPGAKIERFHWPLLAFRNWVRSRWLRLIGLKLAGWLVVVQLALRARRSLNEQNYDIIYGYEVHGALAVRILRLFLSIGAAKVVTRFQGTWMVEILEQRQTARLLWNLDQVVALRTPCDLCIMTDDGTRGAKALALLDAPGRHKLRFWINGVDPLRGSFDVREALDISSSTLLLLSVSRLEGWKRVERNIEVARILADRGISIQYLVVGEGAQRSTLEALVKDCGLSHCVKFLGAVKHSDVASYLLACDVFISMYDLSNVGNPLLEAISAGKIVVTINNGDTGSWISHGVNGFIYDLDAHVFNNAARDIETVWRNPDLRERLESGVRELAKRRLWSWDERMEREVRDVASLLG